MYRVFIVDDEPFIIEGLYHIIDWAELGLEIVGYAENGRKAIDAIKQTTVDILLTDISMPVMNGLDLIRMLRDNQEVLKVIVLSGFNDFSYLKEAMGLGIENYLLKPINIEELRATLMNVIEKLDSFKEGQMIAAFNTQILKDNTLHRWLTGRIGASEFLERADLLDMELNHPLLTAAVIRVDNDHTEVFELLDHHVKHDQMVTLFRDVDGDFVLLAVMDDEQQGREQFLQIMRDIQNKLEKYRPLSISIGSVEQLMEHAAISYSHAKRTQDYFWLYPERILLDYADLPHSHQAEDFSFDWEAYVRALISKNKENLHEQIKLDFNRLQALPGVTPQDIQNFAFELTIRFKVELKTIRHTDDSELFHEAFQRIRETGTVVELCHRLQAVADMSVDCLKSDVKSPVVQQVLNHIDKAYADELSLKLLGVQYNIHPVYLGQLFHKETGQTFTEFMNKYRIDKAKELLTTTNMKVHEIARSVGYWETGYFYKQFRKYVGISPIDYKGLL